MSTKKIASVAFTGVAAAGAVGFAAAPAFAAGAHITAGGVPYHGPYAGVNKNGTTTVLVDKTKNVTLTCHSASTTGNIPSASPSTSSVATVATANFTNCSFLGVAFNASLAQPTELFAANVTAAGATGHIGNATHPISANLKGTTLTACTAKIVGNSIPAQYNNAGHSLNVNSGHTPTLKLQSVTTACPTIKNGDSAYFAATYSVVSPASLSIKP